MATRTQTQTVAAKTAAGNGPGARVGVAPNRAFDHLYDKDYRVSGARDHARRQQAATNTARLVAVPNDTSMFSDLVHMPRNTVRLESTQRVPPSVVQDFSQLQQHAQVQASRDHATIEPSGRHNALFTGRPRIPYMRAHDATVMLDASVRTDVGASVSTGRPRAQTPATRTVAVQTMYRESETQTDPWTPEYVVRPGSAPEVLTLATLSYGQGLPAGLAEVEMIERARAKRAWEKTLPDVNDKSRMKERIAMMEEQEAREWKVREEEIEKLQAQRLELLREHLSKREDEQQMMTTQKLQERWETRQAEKNKKIERMHRQALASLRKLAKQREAVEAKPQRRSIVGDYANFGSDVYAPRTMTGAYSMDRNVASVQTPHLSTLQGLLDLEASLPEAITQPRIVQPKRSKRVKGHSARMHARLQETLKDLDQTLKLQRTMPRATQAPPRFCEKVEKPPQRPPTPEVETPDEVEERREQALVFIQQLLRGRAVQNAMFEGKEARRELIDELRSTHALRQAEKELKEQERQQLLEQRRQEREAVAAQAAEQGTVGQVVGQHVGQTLDFLSKELVRLQEERRIHAFVMLAERQRRMREAEESGKRQREEKLRAQQDEIFRQIVNVHQNTIESYLEDVILGAQADTADVQAREEIRNKASAINAVATEMHDSGYDQTELGAQTIAAELVSSFLLPEVAKKARRQELQRNQRKFIKAAHESVYASSRDAETASKRPTTASQGQGEAAAEDHSSSAE